MAAEGGRVEVRRPPHLRLYGLIALMVLFWSLNFIIGKFALREFPALLLSGLRTTLAALFIAPVYLFSLRHPPAAGVSHGENLRRDWRALLFLGGVGVALNQVCFVAGLSRTSVAHAALIMGMTPILVLLLAARAGQERIGARKLAGMGVALAGVAALNASSPQGAPATLVGDFLIFLASLSFAVFTVAGKPVTLRHGSITVNTAAYLTGSAALSPLTIALARGFPFEAVSAAGWGSLLYMALFPSMVCYLIYYYALARIPASRLAAFSYVQPLLATALALPLLGERVSAGLVAGGGLVLAGVYLTERG